MSSATDIKRRHEERLLQIPRVVGVAVGTKEGRDCIIVFTDADPDEIRSVVPRTLDDMEVEVVHSGRFRAR
jgi:hypothetical protein